MKELARETDAEQELVRDDVVGSRRRVAWHNEPGPDEELSEEARYDDVEVKGATSPGVGLR
jgi:hypothetical protein